MTSRIVGLGLLSQHEPEPDVPDRIYHEPLDPGRRQYQQVRRLEDGQAAYVNEEEQHTGRISEPDESARKAAVQLHEERESEQRDAGEAEGAETARVNGAWKVDHLVGRVNADRQVVSTVKRRGQRSRQAEDQCPQGVC